MIIKPDWNAFRAKFSENPQDAFEWFCYLLFCREHELDKGWFGFKNQAGIEKQPLNYNNKVIGHQAKFYDTKLSDNKEQIISCIDTVKRHYSAITTLIFYTNQLWGAGKAAGSKSKALIDIESHASNNNVEIIWKEHSFFESEFVTSVNSDLARHFFSLEGYQGWERFSDWSSKQANVNSEYFVDENIKIITPNHKNNESNNVVDGINCIRRQLHNPKSSVRLVGLSGVGKTRLAQALFDERIGENPLSVRDVWYCDFGASPNPIPIHFIDELKQKNQHHVVIVDNCGQTLHSELTKLIANDDHLISLLTIEYDISDDLPENTNVYKLEPNSEAIVKKVIQRHYPNIESASTIAELTGGNYRLALAIASNLDKADNIAVLSDNELFKRIFYQNGEINESHYHIAQICSLVFSFNVNDLMESDSELNLLSEFADVTPKVLKKAIQQLKFKDIVQQRGDFRAILPHVLANHLAKQYLKLADENELIVLFGKMSPRLQRSFIKRVSYLHDVEVIKKVVESLFSKNGVLGKKLIAGSLADSEYEYFILLSHIQPKVILNLLDEIKRTNPNYFSRNNKKHEEIARLLKNLSLERENFEQAFWLLIDIVKTSDDYQKNDSILEMLTSMFRFYTSESMADLGLKKKILEDLFGSQEYDIVFQIISVAIELGAGGVIYQNTDVGKKLTSGYQAKTYQEIWDWVDFLLEMFSRLESKGFEVRKIVANRLSSMIDVCGNLQVISKQILNFHAQKPFSEALSSLKNYLFFNHEELTDKAPKLLSEINSLVEQLEPPENDIKQLLATYILIDEMEVYLYSKDACEEEFYKSIPNFKSYEAFTDYIIESLLAADDISSYLPELIKCNNSVVERIGYEIYEKYQTIESFLNDLNSLAIEDLKFWSFLKGCLKKIKEKSFEDYKNIMIELVQSEQYQQIIPIITIELCDSSQEIDLMCELLNQNSTIDFFAYYFIASKKHDKLVSQEDFNKLVDCLMAHDVQNALNQICIMESHYGGKFTDNHRKLFNRQIISLYKENSFNFRRLLEFFLSSSNDINNIFSIFKNFFQERRFLSLSEGTNTNIVFSLLIKANTTKFITEFIENGYLKERVFVFGDIHRILYYADADEVIAWVYNDQDKLNYWIENSCFSKSINSFDETQVIWSDLIIKLLKHSGDHKLVIDAIFNNDISHIDDWTGSLSSEMQSRHSMIDSLIKFFQENGLEKYISYIDTKRDEWQQKIETQIQKENEESNESQGFDY